jgi:hypothetical protein
LRNIISRKNVRSKKRENLIMYGRISLRRLMVRKQMKRTLCVNSDLRIKSFFVSKLR